MVQITLAQLPARSHRTGHRGADHVKRRRSKVAFQVIRFLQFVGGAPLCPAIEISPGNLFARIGRQRSPSRGGRQIGQPGHAVFKINRDSWHHFKDAGWIGPAVKVGKQPPHPSNRCQQGEHDQPQHG